MRPLLLEGLCDAYSHATDPLEVYGAMCKHMIQVPTKRAVLLEEELAKVKGELAESQWNTEKKKLVEDYLGLRKRHEEVTSQRDKLKDESSGFNSRG
ncbi:hypothetical protein LIER_20185 [Lithospermum erythrorhizon]|uniref:Uncharacterized protein n=1 Tax=Lithospermum erythrorhizon TaxID=34254 RepID=A0AAV3QKL9_LITER